MDHVGDHGHRTASLAGLEDAFCEVECYEVIAMDPAPGVSARLSVWSRKAKQPSGFGRQRSITG